MSNMRLAIVVQRYGVEVLGGAEDAARALAEQLTALAEVHVITSCAKQYTSWANEYPAGTSELNGVTVHRFPVDRPRDWSQAHKNNGRFLQEAHSLSEQMGWIQANGPYSSQMLQFMATSVPQFDRFIFMTYLYAPTFFGLPLVAAQAPEKVILLPTAHDEPFLYTEAYRILCHLPHHLVYLTEAERQIVHRITGNGRVPSTVAAIGIEAPADVSAARFRQKYGVTGDFLLYGGRLAEAKNVPELLQFFQRYRQERPERPLKLLLMGAGELPIPTDADIVSLGFVSEQDKFDALQAATAVVQPSLFESLSIIILQAWLMGTAVLVHGRCEVTKQQCRSSNGGLYYNQYDEFTAVVDRLLQDKPLRHRLGQQGQQFVRAQYSWANILAQYAAILEINEHE